MIVALHRRSTVTSSGSSRSAGCLQVGSRAPTTRPRRGRRRPGGARRGDDPGAGRCCGSTNCKVYGAHKLWKAARRAGHDIGRDQVARLMRAAGIEGVRRGAKGVHHPTRPDALPGTRTSSSATSPRRPERVVGHRPDLRADLGRDGLRVLHRRRVLPDDRRLAGRVRTCAPTWSSTRSRWPGGPRGSRASRARCHSDAGSQFTSCASRERLDEIGARPSIGTVADSLRQRAGRDDQRALQDRVHLRARHAATVDDVDDVELATLGWVHWFNDGPPPQPLRRRPARRVRSSVLRCPTDRPTTGVGIQ